MDVWSCGGCTFNNDGCKSKCEMCDSHRGRGEGYQSSGTSPYGHGAGNEVRIVLLGKTGSGKSATGNTILNGEYFDSTVSGSSVTSRCTSHFAQINGREIQVVDTPGIFDTNTPNDVVQREIVKCIGITSPGPHCFVLVLGLTRFTQEEEESVKHFVNYFGESIFRYFIILFTRKDDLDYHGKTLDDHIKTVPRSLMTIIQKCDHRCIAFNNRAPSPARLKQVENLLNMIDEIVCRNNGKFYTNHMYSEAEKVMKDREDQIERERQRKLEREREEMKREIEKKYQRETSAYLENKCALETRVAELESTREYYTKRSSALEGELHKMKIEFDHERERNRYSQSLPHQTRQEDERCQFFSRTEKDNEKEIELLKLQLRNMKEESEKKNKEKDKLFKKKLKNLEEKYNQLESARKEARKEVESDSGDIGDMLINGIKFVWKGFKKIFL